MTAWQIAGDANIWTVFNSLAGAGYTSTVQCNPGPSGQAQYTVILSFPGMPQQQGTVGDWIVFDGARAYIYTTAKFNALYKAGP